MVSISQSFIPFFTAISAYLFFTTIAGTISTAILNVLSNAYIHDKSSPDYHPERFGYILCAFVVFGYLCSIPFFYLAGLSYTKFKTEERRIKEQL